MFQLNWEGFKLFFNLEMKLEQNGNFKANSKTSKDNKNGGTPSKGKSNC